MLEFVIGYSMGTQGQARAASLARSMDAAQGGRHAARVEQVNAKVENMSLILRAMWSLLQDQGMTSDQLLDRIEEIQRRLEEEANDGVPDGIRCGSCESMVARGLPKCQICGAKMLGNHADPLDI